VLDYTGKTVLVVTSNGIARFAPHCLATFPIWRQHHRPKLATGAIAIFEHDGTSWDCTQWDIKPNCKPAA
ncbi:MAG: phosphoglycerate mutase, partial [Gammaproteobacteria bacterium]